MALELTPPVTVMNTNNLPGYKALPARKADNITVN
jgi:hypothetical protein